MNKVQPIGDWRPISEKPLESGVYLVCAASADPDLPLRHIAHFFAEEGRWSGIVPYWVEALEFWQPYPKTPYEEDAI